jgi:hypothetical protein
MALLCNNGSARGTQQHSAEPKALVKSIQKAKNSRTNMKQIILCSHGTG